MLVWLATLFSQQFHFLSVFNYLTLRAILSVLTAFIIALCLGPMMIRLLSRYKVGQVVRDDGPASHLSKSGTPTMGGLLILKTVTLTTLLWANLSNHYIWLVLFVMIGYGGIGFIDDFRKLVLQNTKGLPGRWKLFWQSLVAVIAVSYLYLTASTPVETALLIPFVKFVLPLGWFFIIFSSIVIVGTSNAVNLTDGLDGLAILPVVMVGGALGIFAYLTGNSIFSHYLLIPYIANVSEVVIICASIVGAGLGFLWFNTYPAQVFMGDMGSLGLGATLGIIAVMVRQELVLFIMGGIFVDRSGVCYVTGCLL